MLIQFVCLQIFFFSNLLAFPQIQDVEDEVFGVYESEYEESNDVEIDVLNDAFGDNGVETDLEDDVFGNFVNCSTLEGFRWVFIQLYNLNSILDWLRICILFTVVFEAQNVVLKVTMWALLRHFVKAQICSLIKEEVSQANKGISIKVSHTI